MQRISTAVPKADVVVTNPEHIAVAIRYDAETMTAPKVLAKGGPVDVTDPGQMCHGGPFAKVALGNSGLATMNVINDKKTT